MPNYENRYIEHFDDERSSENGVIVTLHYGYSFESCEHQGVRGFDTVTEARNASLRKNITTCACEECLLNLSSSASKLRVVNYEKV